MLHDHYAQHINWSQEQQYYTYIDTVTKWTRVQESLKFIRNQVYDQIRKLQSHTITKI
jgi:hypothetical protein